MNTEQERAEPVWETFTRYLIEQCEGETITEEGLQRALSDMLNDSRYAPQPAEPVKVPRLYQHDDGRYGLSFGPARFTEGNPAWHRLPIDVIETQEET